MDSGSSGSALYSNSSSSSSSANGESKELHMLLTNVQFAFLVVFCAVCHYVALIISAIAVGESTSTLVLPFVMVKKVSRGFVTAAVNFIQRRRQRVFVGLNYEDDGASIDHFDAMNQPSGAGLE